MPPTETEVSLEEAGRETFSPSVLWRDWAQTFAGMTHRLCPCGMVVTFLSWAVPLSRSQTMQGPLHGVGGDLPGIWICSPRKQFYIFLKMENLNISLILPIRKPTRIPEIKKCILFLGTLNVNPDSEHLGCHGPYGYKQRGWEWFQWANSALSFPW